MSDTPAVKLTKAHVGVQNRVQYDDRGKLDEVVTDGGAHFERLGKREWYLSCFRADGSSFVIWIDGKVTMTEERSPPAGRALLDALKEEGEGRG